jgi:hypothetical protein
MNNASDDLRFNIFLAIVFLCAVMYSLLNPPETKTVVDLETTTYHDVDQIF